jgi:hypothetical protein
MARIIISASTRMSVASVRYRAVEPPTAVRMNFAPSLAANWQHA